MLLVRQHYRWFAKLTGEYNGPVLGNILPSHDFNAAEKDGQNRMKKGLDSKIQQGLQITNENVRHQNSSRDRNVPRGE